MAEIHPGWVAVEIDTRHFFFIILNVLIKKNTLPVVKYEAKAESDKTNYKLRLYQLDFCILHESILKQDYF